MISTPASCRAAVVAASPVTSATGGLQHTPPNQAARGGWSGSRRTPRRPRRTAAATQAAPPARRGLAAHPHPVGVETLHDGAGQQIALGDLLDDRLDLLQG